MAPRNALILQYSHLNKLPRADEALQILRRVASLVKPVMRARNWKVGTLAEFYPRESNLLGINKNRGEQICLRLRYDVDQRQFLPFDQVVDTMLHELSHIVYGPHDEKFHALWDRLRSELEGLMKKGYTGEGFLSEGRKLGGQSIFPIHDVRHIAREAAAAAEKRILSSSRYGRKLGGCPLPAFANIRDVIYDAVQRRNIVLNGCGEGIKNEKEIGTLASQATLNGFASQAEEDEANDRAIAEALWEFVHEDMENDSNVIISPTTQNLPCIPSRNVRSSRPILKDSADSARPDLPGKKSSRRILSQVVSDKVTKKQNNEAKNTVIFPPPWCSSKPPLPKRPLGWTCPICTLYNPQNFLACNACNSERSIEITQRFGREEKITVKSVQSTLHDNIWTCSRCSNRMEEQWWACSSCGKLKDHS